MAIVRLEPSATGAGDMTVVGAATAHEALSDASDSSYVQGQVSQFETFKEVHGALADLPDGTGTVAGTVINVRANFNSGNGRLAAGEYPNQRLTNALTGAITDYSTAALDLGQAAAVNALSWQAGVAWVSVDGSVLRIYKMNFDVDCEFISGVAVAMIFQWLGPLVAVGLQEMPRLSRELWRRSRLWLRQHELEAAWLEMREDRGRRYSLPILARPVSR